jgi:hypothetical protein
VKAHIVFVLTKSLARIARISLADVSSLGDGVIICCMELQSETPESCAKKILLGAMQAHFDEIRNE